MSSAETPRFDAVAAAEQIHQQQSLDLPWPTGSHCCRRRRLPKPPAVPSRPPSACSRTN